MPNEAPASHPATATQVAPIAKKKSGALRAYLILATLAGGAVGAYFIHRYMTRNEVSTDDAEVDADVVPVSTRVGGLILQMHVHDNQHVIANEIIADIDPKEYIAKRDAADADLKSAEDAAEVADAQIPIVKSNSNGGLSSARAELQGNSASVRSAAAHVQAQAAMLARANSDLAKAESDLARAKKLSAEGAVTAIMLENMQAARETAKANVDLATANLQNARDDQAVSQTKVSAAQAHVEQSTPVDQVINAALASAKLAHAKVASAKAAFELADLQSQYTTIRSPVDGYVSKLAVHDGQLVQMGTPLLMIVPSVTYVVANFKETQLSRIRPDDDVDITIDSIGDHVFHGKVDSVSPGTGARFSMMPPDNASGNFVKVVQRVPVKITWATGQDVTQLHAGLSAEVTVNLK